MIAGDILEAPDGWGILSRGVEYRFLRNDGVDKLAYLVQFDSPHKGPVNAVLLSMPSRKFEDGIASGAIVSTSDQCHLPPWLKELEGVDFALLDEIYRKAKIPKSQRVENRFLHIANAVHDYRKILSSPHPEKDINRYARACSPAQNEKRFRLWFLTYLCFGQNIWSLMPPFHRSGHWDRTLFPETKFGPPSLAFGKHYGNGCSKELIERICEGYRRRAKLGAHMSKIYQRTVIEDFRCEVVKNDKGIKVFFHPEGHSFPTYWQFRYRVMLRFGREVVQKMLYGSVRYRTRIARSKGRFSEEVANLMERVEADGYYVKERPQPYVDNASLPPLCVVVGRDVLSGKKLGIGFSFGAERATAYRMMLFSMAVPKDYFCELFGIPYATGEWENQGLPPHFAIDRGPGARKDLAQAIEARFPIRDMAPSWSGQSKATIESSHPRDVHFEGEPSYVQSSLTPVELARREIIRLMEFNNGSLMNDRIDPDRELAHVIPTPNGLWAHYDHLGRNDAQPISLDDAIRILLTPTEFELRDDGVYLEGRRYSSPALEALDEKRCSSTPERPATRVCGYVLDMCIRYVWVEMKGQLLRLGAKLRIRGDEETFWMSLEELHQWGTSLRQVESAMRIHQHANTAEFRTRFETLTGKAWDAGQRRSGTPKRRRDTSEPKLRAPKAA